MSHFDLHEQEQISNLKYFWQRGGKYLAGVIIVALIGFAGNSWWNWQSSSHAANAAAEYSEFTSATDANDNSKTLAIAAKLQKDYPTTEYAAMASMTAAKVAWKKNDLKTAVNLLNWTIANAKDQGLVSVSRLRLADIYIDQGKFDLAMNLMFEKHDPAFDPLYYTKRGDLYVAKGDLNKARDAYKEAIQKAGQDTSMAQGVQMRLDVLGNS